jgi:predicted transcriptional regulator
MVKKRQSISEEIARNMEDRAIGEPSANIEADEVALVAQITTNATQKTTKGYKNTVISIRFDEGDYERLREIAREQGTNGAALIRKAVKDIIREAENTGRYG